MKYLGSLFSLAVLGLIVSSFVSGPLNTGLSVGEVAPDFKLKGVDDKMVSLADYKDAKGYIVIFTCNHCPFAKAYEDRIIALSKKYGPQGYHVIAINPNDPMAQPEDSFAKMQERAKEKGFNFPYLLDEGQKIYPQYGATKTPHVYLLDSKRVVKYIGAIDDNTYEPQNVKEKYLENALEALKAGKAISPSNTKAVGCTIKVKK